MKNVLLNLPFKHTTNISLIREIYNRYNIKTLHILTHKIISNPPNTNTKQISIFQDVSVYLNYHSERKYFFDDDPNFYKYKYNLISIIHRWSRTYFISKDFHNIDLLSNKIFHYWNDYLIKNEISFILLNQPHTPHDYAIYTLSKHLGINLLLLSPINLPLNQHVNYLISKDHDWTNPLLSVDETPKTISKKITPINSNSINNNFEGAFIKSNINNEKNFISSKKILKEIYITIYKLLNRIKLIILYTLDIFYRQYILNLTSKDIPSEKLKFIYFPLHFQPEATTVPTGNHYSDLLEIIRKIYPAIENKLILVVKEHPYYWKKKLFKLSLYNPMYITRPLKFYRELLSYKNIIFIHPKTNSNLLISKSIAVITVSGSVAYESYLLKKPSFIFGEHYYLNLPNVRKFSYSIFDEFLINPSKYYKQIKDNEYYKDFPKLMTNNSIEKTHTRTDNGFIENEFNPNVLYLILNSYLEKK